MADPVTRSFLQRAFSDDEHARNSIAAIGFVGAAVSLLFAIWTVVEMARASAF